MPERSPRAGSASRADWWWFGGAALILAANAAYAIGRPGYTPDEEITAVLARATTQTGGPILPSGVFYHRGLPYTYLAAAFGALGGQSLEVYRLVSLLSGLVGVGLIFAVGREHGRRMHGYVGALLLATLPAYAAAAVFARYYTALAASVLLVLWLFARWWRRRQREWPFLGAVALANAFHPIGVVLCGLPVVASLVSKGDGATWRLAARTLAVAAGMQTVVHGLHGMSLLATHTRVSTDIAVYSMPRPPIPAFYYTIEVSPLLWWVAGIAVFGAGAWLLARRRASVDALLVWVAATLALAFQLGGLVVLMGLTMLIAPDRGRRLSYPAALMFALAIVWWPLQMALHTSVAYSPALAFSLSGGALRFPFGGVLEIAAWHPALALASLIGLVIAVTTDSEMSRLVRTVGALGLATLAGYDALGVSLLERYLLIPMVLILFCASHGLVEGAAIAYRSRLGRSTSGRLLMHATASIVVVWMAFGFYSFGQRRAAEFREPPRTTGMAPETGARWTPASFSGIRESDDVIVCTEELACEYLLGRTHYLLATEPDDAAHYVVERRGGLRGFYADVPAIVSPHDFVALIERQPAARCVTLVALYTGKVEFGAYRSLAMSLAPGFRVSVLRDESSVFVARFCGG